MPKKKKILLICLASILALLLFTATLLPIIVRSKALAIIENETGRKVRIEKVDINPFALTVSVKGFAIDAKGGGPFVSIAGLHLQGAGKGSDSQEPGRTECHCTVIHDL